MSEASGPQIALDPNFARTVGRYEILHEIASGGMATVFLGRMSGIAGFERIVAIKCCRESLRRDEQFVSMFLDEARLGAQIRHPNVVAIVDVGDEEELYLVMDYVEGGQLSDLIRTERNREQCVPTHIALRVMLDMLAGLDAAHDTRDARGNPLNIIHRDVTPSNILVGSDGVTRLTDFGIAKAEMRATATMRGVVKGKLGYTAPEQLDPDAVIDRRVDIFSSGIVLWEMLTGQGLYRGKNDGETVRLIMEAEIQAPSSIVADVPDVLDAITLKALSRSPEGRYATASAFAEDIEQSGLRLATPREITAYVQELLGAKIENQRALVKHFMGTEPPASRSSQRASVAPPGMPTSEPVTRSVTPVTRAAYGAGSNPSGLRGQASVEKAPEARGTTAQHANLKWLVYLLAGLLVASLSTIVFLWLRNPRQGPVVSGGGNVSVDASTVTVAPTDSQVTVDSGTNVHSVAAVLDASHAAGSLDAGSADVPKADMGMLDAGTPSIEDSGRRHRHHHRRRRDDLEE